MGKNMISVIDRIPDKIRSGLDKLHCSSRDIYVKAKQKPPYLKLLCNICAMFESNLPQCGSSEVGMWYYNTDHPVSSLDAFKLCYASVHI